MIPPPQDVHGRAPVACRRARSLGRRRFRAIWRWVGQRASLHLTAGARPPRRC